MALNMHMYNKMRAAFVALFVLANALDVTFEEECIENKDKTVFGYILLNTCGQLLLVFQRVLSASWDVTVYTGNVDEGGTDANVFIQLHGSIGSSRVIELDNDDDNFEMGEIDYFSDLYTSNIGMLRSIDIWHDDRKHWSGWFLNKVVVTNRQTRVTNTFICDRWLDLDEGDRRIGLHFDV